MYSRAVHILAVLVMLIGSTGAAVAQQQTGKLPAAFEGVGIDEHLGDVVPGDITLKNEDGESVTIGDYLDGDRPVLLNLVYHDCPMLCNLVLDGLTNTLQGMKWVPGAEFDVLTVSFNAAETPELARSKKEQYMEELGKPAAAPGWHFLTGDSTSIHALTEAVGFHFRWVEEKQQFAHPTAFIFLSGTGKITRYLYGMEVAPKDARAALVEASEGKVGTTVDKVFLYCFQYDPNANSYVANAVNIMKLGGVLTMLALGSVLFVFWRREARKHSAPDDVT